MKKPALVSIRWTVNQPPYNAGEVCGRQAKDALILVGQGVAVYVDPPPGLDEEGKRLKPPDPPKKVSVKKAKPKAKAKAKPKGKPKGKS